MTTVDQCEVTGLPRVPPNPPLYIVILDGYGYCIYKTRAEARAYIRWRLPQQDRARAQIGTV